MSALARFGVSGVPPLAWAVENEFFAGWAASALGEIGDGSATATLIAALDNENISDEVLEALGMIGDVKAVPALATLLGRTWSDEAVAALARIGGPDAANALVEHMADPDPVHRSMVAFALGKMHESDGVPRLIEATKDPDIRVRSAAADALEEMDYDAATVERLRPTTTELKGTLRSADANLRAAAARLLGVRREHDVADALVAVLVDPETDVRKAAMMSLAQLRDPRIVGPLLELLFTDQSELAGVDGSIAWALGAVGTPEAVFALISALDESEDRQDTVVEGLIRTGPAAVAPLASVLETADQAFQVSIGRVLVAIGPASIEESVRLLDSPARTVAAEILRALGEEAEQVVIARLTSAAAPEREAAVFVLQGIGTARSVEPLLSLLADANADVRAAAMVALIAIGEPSVDHLVVALSSEDPQVRAAAAQALGQIGLHRAIDVLIAALDDSEPRVRLQALLAIAAVARFVPEDRVPRLLNDPDVVVRLMSHAVLDTAPEAEITPAEARELVEALGHVDRDLAWAAGSMLVEAGDFASLAHALVGPDELARDASRAVLLDADPETIAPLAALRQGASRELRTAIDRILASHGDRKAIKTLISSLNEDSLAPGDVTASILLEVADASVPVLVGRMADAKLGPVYVELIGRTGAAAIDPLIAQLTGHELETQAIAADLLSRIGRPAVRPLIELLDRGDGLEPRMLAIEALSKLDHPRAAAALAAVADAPSSDSGRYPIDLRLAAVEALSRSRTDPAASGLRRASGSGLRCPS